MSSLTSKVLSYPLILDNIKINGLITLSNYPIEYLELVFLLINFEMTILSTLTSQIFIGSLHHEILIVLLILSHQIST